MTGGGSYNVDAENVTECYFHFGVVIRGSEGRPVENSTPSPSIPSLIQKGKKIRVHHGIQHCDPKVPLFTMLHRR